MRNLASICLSTMVALGLLAGCSGPLSSIPSAGTGGGNVPFSMVVTDTPTEPTNVAVLSFEITITGAALQPGNVSLISAPQTIELTQLQAETGFLAAATIPANTYSSLTLTLANPTMIFLNETGSTIGSCANGSICSLNPTLASSTVTFSTSPFPLTVSSSSPVGLLIDLSLRNLIQSDLSINPGNSSAVTPTQLTAASSTSQLAELDDVVGRVVSIGSNQFNFLAASGQQFSVNVGSSTQFSFPSSVCAANNFTCVLTNQVLETNLSLLGNGKFQALSVAFLDNSGTPEVEGFMTGLNSASPPVIQMIVESQVPAVTNVSVGTVASVTVESTATFSVDANGLPTSTPPGLSFASSSDLITGQKLLVHASTPATSSSAGTAAFSTDRVVLRKSQLTAVVGLINAGSQSFDLTSLPPLFPANSAIPVQTLTPQTLFFNLTPDNFSGIATNNTVSVKGLLFATPSPPTIVASKVLGRSLNGP